MGVQLVTRDEGDIGYGVKDVWGKGGGILGQGKVVVS